jgi:galactonate dehydratase
MICTQKEGCRAGYSAINFGAVIMLTIRQNRRRFFATAGASFFAEVLVNPEPCLAIPTLPEIAGGKITSYEPIIVRVNDVGEGTWDFVRLSTDIGITGIGEASHSGYYPAKVRAMDEVFPLARGLSPFEIEVFRQRFLAKGPHTDGPLTTAFSGIEQAMWDLAGKLAGLPVAHLLGGSLVKRIRAYANINRATRGNERTPEGFAANAKRALNWGFTAIKMAPFDDMPPPAQRRDDWRRTAEPGLERIAAVREVIGPETDLLIDVHSHFDMHFAVQMAERLKPYNLFWIEEPVPSTHPEEAGRISDLVDIRTAGGEHLFGLSRFGNLLKHGAWDIFMPDVKHCGGILEMRKIASIAESGGHACAPHNPTGPVATAASTQCCSTMPNFLILEYAWGETDWSRDLISPREEFIDGHLVLHDAPGLGIDLNPDVVEAHRIK